jgi:hypothetical protein
LDYAWWIEHIFGTLLSAKNTPESAALASSLPPAEALQFMTRVFTNCWKDLARFSDLQVSEGLTYIGAAGESDWMYLIYDRTLSWGERVACIRSIVPLYRDCFARRCANSITRLQAAPGAINSVCYMWWDRFPSGGLDDTTTEELRAVDGELIAVMSDALQVPHDACRESALHGLGHWHSADAKRVNAIVDDWLARNPDLPQSLVEYAKASREGQVP